MKIATFSLLILALIAGDLRAGDDGSVLARFDGECRRLAARADAATVEISVPGVNSWALLPDPRKKLPASGIGLVYELLGKSAVVAKSSAAGVLVGTPPVLVTSADAVGSATIVSFRLADGTRGTAGLKGADADLGVAVFTLPEEVAKGREGLTVTSWWRVRRGRLVLIPGPGRLDVLRPLSLALCRGSAPLCGWFCVDGLTGAPLLGRPAIASDGRLLGIAAGSVGTTSGHTTRPVAYFGGSEELRRLQMAWSQSEDGQVRAAAVLGLGLMGSDGLLYNKYWPMETAGDPLPEGSFIQGSVIARVLDDLEKHGAVRHAYLGVVLGQMRGKGEERGVEIQSVLEGSPAESAGLTRGALIWSVAGVTVEEPALVTRALVLHRPGDSMRIEIVGAKEPITVVLGDRTSATESLLTPAQLGLTCVELGSELASFLQVPEGTRGVVVQGIRPKSPAALAGFARGQVIISAAGEPVADLEELRAAVAGAKGELELTVLAAGEPKLMTIRIPKRLGSRAR